ncbi:hypothetical protein P879_12035, partial [Paragonimus westermani]
PALYRKNVRTSKYDPLVEVEPLESNPEHAHIRLPDGREETVSLRQLAPFRNTSDLPQTILSDPIPNPSIVDTLSITSDTTETTSISETSVEDLISQQQKVRPYSIRNHEA